MFSNILKVFLVASAFVCLTSSLGAACATQDSDDPPTSTSTEESDSTTESDPTTEEPEKTEAELLLERVKEVLPEEENKGLVKDIKKVIEKNKSEALITNDAIIFGILAVMLGLIFWTSSIKTGFFGFFYKCIPMLLICYFMPSLLTFFEIVDHHNSNLYFVATRYLLPATLVLLTLSIDLKEILGLGPKALIMFLTGTVGVVFGGPLAVLIVSYISPEIIGVDGPDAVWRGLSTVAGSWIGGGANQAAMQVVFMTPDADATTQVQENLTDLYSTMVAVDVFVAEIWMIFLLLGVGKAKTIDRFFKADASSIERLQEKMENFSLSVARVPTSTDYMVIAALGFGATAISHFCGAWISDYVTSLIEANESLAFLKDLGLASSFFWLIVISTTIGIALSFTRLRNYEGAGASKIGTVFIFILVAVIGMGMDIRAVAENPGYFLIGGIWMLFHVGLMFLMAWAIRAPYFFLAVGSKANIGGAASAPVVAAAFHPALAPVGVLLAVLGYALGTYGAMICAWMMQAAT
jgi:uncharacterized membrane protein